MQAPGILPKKSFLLAQNSLCFWEWVSDNERWKMKNKQPLFLFTLGDNSRVIFLEILRGTGSQLTTVNLAWCVSIIGLPPVLVLVLSCSITAFWDNLWNKWLVFKQLSPILHLGEDTRRHACCPWVILKRAFFVSSFSPCIHVDGWIDR